MSSFFVEPINWRPSLLGWRPVGWRPLLIASRLEAIALGLEAIHFGIAGLWVIVKEAQGQQVVQAVVIAVMSTESSRKRKLSERPVKLLLQEPITTMREDVEILGLSICIVLIGSGLLFGGTDWNSCFGGTDFTEPYMRDPVSHQVAK